MIIAYHAIFTTYGTWLPNDPRGSYSKNIYNAELRTLGDIQYGRQSPQPNSTIVRRFHTAAMPRLARQPYYINELSRDVVAAGFAKVVQRLHLIIPACSIMDNHVHILVMRSKYRVEYLVNQLQGEATAALGLKSTPWTNKCWKVFIDEDEVLPAVIRYIEANPESAGLSPQRWDFVTSLSDAVGRDLITWSAVPADAKRQHRRTGGG